MRAVVAERDAQRRQSFRDLFDRVRVEQHRDRCTATRFRWEFDDHRTTVALLGRPPRGDGGVHIGCAADIVSGWSTPGTPGIDISPSPCSPTLSSPSPHTKPKKGAPKRHATRPAGELIQRVDRTRDHSTRPPTPDRAHPRRNPSTTHPRSQQPTGNPPRPTLVDLSAPTSSPDPPSARSASPPPPDPNDLAL